MYAQYLVERGYQVGIIENDFGAVNVDMMLLQEALKEKCDIEMISGGCDTETHHRRLKTKLISMGMLGYDRIIIEPSGIYDVDEFFDILYEEPLDMWYEIGNVIAIVDAKLDYDLSKESHYLLASEIANAGCILLSRSQEATLDNINDTIIHLNHALKQIQCSRLLCNDIIFKNWNELSKEDFDNILCCGYVPTHYTKFDFQQNDVFTSLYFMHIHMSEKQLYDTVKDLLNDSACGKIFRIKGFMQLTNHHWIELNATHNNIEMKPIQVGQEIMIVIGENLNKECIKTYWNRYKA